MGRISDDTIERVLAATNIVELIGSYVKLKRSGSSWMGLCPFHHEKTPSFHVSPSRQAFHCFGCGAGGTALRFVIDYEHVDFPSAVRRLAQRAGIPVAEDEPGGDAARHSERNRMLALHREAASWFHANLMRREIGAPARSYLKGRGIASEIAERWQLGFAPAGWEALSDWARQQGYSDSELVTGGMAVARETGRVFDRFRNRVIFPIRSDFGEVIAFSGRTLGDDRAKYVNSPETPLFTKGRVLFGLDKTKAAIIEANEAVVCEGQIDLISAFEAGVRNMIAPQGTAFTTQQARILRRFAESVVLCFDADSAGQNAIDRSLPALLASGFVVKVARMPEGEDPDSVVRKRGPDAFRQVVRDSIDYFDHALMSRAGQSTAQAKAKLAQKLSGPILMIADPAIRETTAKRVAIALDLSFATFEEIMRKQNAPAELPEDAPPAQEVLELSERARLVCRIALGDRDARQWLRSQPAAPGCFGDEFLLLEKIAQSDVDPSSSGSWARFLAGLTGPEERAMAGLRMDHLPADPAAAIKESWRALLSMSIRREIEILQTRQRSAASDLQTVAALHKQILDLQKRLEDV